MPDDKPEVMSDQELDELEDWVKDQSNEELKAALDKLKEKQKKEIQ